MNVKEHLGLASNKRPAKGSSGEESAWLELSDFKLRGKHLQMVDMPSLASSHAPNSVAIPAQPGSYTVECRVISYGGDRRISKMRILPQGKSVERGKAAGAIAMGIGGIVITDVDVLASFAEENEEEYQEWFENTLNGKSAPKTAGVLRCKDARTEIPYASGGFGDGVYKVFQLVSGKQVVGLELEFIPTGTKYPF